jgi:hypothetical protein
MRATNWLDAVSGDFGKSAKWDDGKPRANTDAVIAATGAAYVVKVNSADAAHSLTLDSADATLREKAGGSLDLGALNIEAGTAVLTQANTIGSTAITDGELDFSKGAALGDATISMTRATLSATANTQIANDIAVRQATFEVSNGNTLKLDGHLSLDTTTSEHLNFIGNAAKGAPDGSGIVDFDGTIGPLGTNTFLLIEGETLGTSIANNTAFDTLLSDVRIDFGAHGVLDLTHQDNITINFFRDNIQGTGGEILNSGTRENLTFESSVTFNGEIKGDFVLTLHDAGLVGTVALKAGDLIHVIGQGGFTGVSFSGDAPSIDMENEPGTNGATELYFDEITSSGAPPAIDMGIGQNNYLLIAHSAVGTISNFGGHDGGTDTIDLGDGSGHGTPTLQYQPNEAGTGGELIVTYAGGPTITLDLAGNYSQNDFTLKSGSTTDIECSADQSSPHVPAHAVDALI